jgi:hypothetical protein
VAKKSERENQRRAVAEQLRKQQQRKERQRSMLILGACILVVLGLLTAALVPYIKHQRELDKVQGTALTKLGVSESAAGCDPILTKPTDKNQTHVPAPQKITYKDAPPSFGPHRPQPAPFERKFYTAADRPEVAELVHNLEHGYVILWYDETAAEDQKEMTAIKAIADKLDKARFIAAPWTSDDGAAFPSGKHISLTRWTADADDPGDEAKQRGNWQYCGQTSGEVVSAFVDKWPNDESPEPGIM